MMSNKINSGDVRRPMRVPKTAPLHNPDAMLCPTAAGAPKDDDIVITELQLVFVYTECVFSHISNTVHDKSDPPDTSVMLYQGF